MSYAEIRKLRKKLRQIEKLERLDRELTDEESAKVSSKQGTRLSLQQLTAGSADEFPTCVFRDKSIDISTSFSNDSFSESAVLTCSEDEKADTRCSEEAGNRCKEEAGTRCIDQELQKETVESKDNKDLLQKMSLLKSRDGVLDQGASVERLTSAEAKNISPQTKVHNVNAPLRSKVEDNLVSISSRSSTVEDKQKHNLDSLADTKLKRSRDESADSKPKHSCDFFVGQLKGHEGVVRAVSMVDDYLVTGSQDTTVKIWSLSHGNELRNLGGHSQPVSAVYIISCASSCLLVNQLRDNDEDMMNSTSCYQQEENDFLIISAALDCTFRLWSLLSGVCIKSVYTFHPLTSVSFLDSHLLIVCGSDGGKLEVWDPVNSNGPIESVLAHEDAITSIVVVGCSLFCGSSDGLVSVFEWSEDRLSRTYESSDAKLSSGSGVCHREIHCLAVYNGTIYYGDDGMNIKALDWKTGIVSKLTNHTTEFGSTRALSVADGFLVSSGYDLDNGIGYINVWSIPEGKYLYTLCDVQTGYIECVACRCVAKGRLAIVTGGSELKTWTPAKSTSLVQNDLIVKSVYVSRFDKEPRHSDIESDCDADDQNDSSSASSSSGDDSSLPWHRPEPVTTSSGWLPRCSLL